MPAHIQGIHPIAVCQCRPDTYPAQGGTGDTMQQHQNRQVSPLGPPAYIMEATSRQINHLGLDSCIEVIHHVPFLYRACQNITPYYATRACELMLHGLVNSAPTSR